MFAALRSDRLTKQNASIISDLATLIKLNKNNVKNIRTWKFFNFRFLIINLHTRFSTFKFKLISINYFFRCIFWVWIFFTFFPFIKFFL